MKFLALLVSFFALSWANQMNNAVLPLEELGPLQPLDVIRQHTRNWAKSPEGFKIIGFTFLLCKAYGYFNDATSLAESLSSLTDQSQYYLIANYSFSLFVVLKMFGQGVWCPRGASKYVRDLSWVLFLCMVAFEANWVLGFYNRGSVEEMSQLILNSRIFACGIPLLELFLHIYTAFFS